MKRKTTKSALFASILALFLCVTMLLGTTFAWFTDSATSSANKIVSGTLVLDLELLDEENGWTSIKESNAPIFDYDKWEPGYTDVKILKVENEGTLALKWKAKFVSSVELSELANVIDVYVCPSADELAYPSDLSDYERVGTVAEFLNTIESTTTGVLLAGEVAYLGIALQMQKEAGNEYQNKDLGGAFDIQILATQTAYEEDSFGSDYDADVNYVTDVSTWSALFNAIENGDDVLLSSPLVVNDQVVEYANQRYGAATFALGDDTLVVDKSLVLDGGGITIYRTEEMADQPLVQVESGFTLVLTNITLDGGAKWTGEVNPVLLRGTTNSGMTTSGAIINMVGSNAAVVLEEGAVLQNNDGANAVFLNTRAGNTLTVNGGEIINNHSAAGAIWGGGAITLNAGKINGNHGGIGGAIRAVTNIGTLLTMNGGEMNHNYSDGNGGAIWAGTSRSNNVYVLNGGEMAYNYSATTGGAIYAGYYETVKIGGTFKMHDNSCAAAIGAEIRFHDHASLVMTGGEVSNEADNAFFLYNNSASITGGKYVGNLGYSGGLGLTLGEAEIDGVITYNLGTNHNTAYLAAEFGSFEFIVNETASNFAQFNFKPAAAYVYVDGDEDKLVCLNEGYTTVWDAEKGVFRLDATN